MKVRLIRNSDNAILNEYEEKHFIKPGKLKLALDLNGNPITENTPEEQLFNEAVKIEVNKLHARYIDDQTNVATVFADWLSEFKIVKDGIARVEVVQ